MTRAPRYTSHPQDYEANYITPLATIFGKYPQVPIVAIIEPDSLPNRA